MRRILSKPVVVFYAFLFGLAVLFAQQMPLSQGEPPQGEQPPAAPAAIAESGLLPLFGATIELDKNWVDGKKYPSNQPVQDAFEQLYTNQLAPCGFNVLRVPFDVNDSKGEESNRLANLCVWAQGKGLKIAPILASAPSGKSFPKDYPSHAQSFVASVLKNLKNNNSEKLGAYAQIALYQLDYPLNSPAFHGVVDPASAAEALKSAATNVRNAETEGLGDSGLSPTQLMVPASFDFELLKNGAMVGTELKPEAYGMAFEALKAYLGSLADSPEIGTFNVEWHPGSITSDATEKLPELIKALMTDVQGKLLVLSTGMSTAFKSNEDQSRFYAMGFANLADIRASEGVDCPFTGIFWNTAVDGGNSNAAPPNDQTAQNMTQWDFAAKSAELVKMWQEGGGDPDLAWWWKKTSACFGILGSADSGFTPKQAHQVLTELQGATAQAAVETGVADAAQKLEEVQAQNAQAQPDPNAPPVDPNTGLPIDPNTGLPIDPNNPPIDPNTGQPIDPNAATAAAGTASVTDELKNTLNGALSQLIGGIIEKGKSGLTNLIGRLLGDPSLTTPGFDPNGGQPPIDPNSGQPIDPNTGLPIDPNTGLPVDPNNPPIDPNTGQPVAATGTSGVADLALEGSVSPPGALTTNEPITLNVGIKNNGDTAATGATAYLIDGNGDAFAASEQTTVEPGASASTTISFTPPSAGSINGVKLQVFCDNESNTADNFADMGTLTISDPPGGVDTGVTPDSSGEPEPGTGAGGRTPGKIGGIIKVRPLPPHLLAGLKPLLGVAIRPPGLVPKLSLIKPGMFNIGTILPGSSAKLVQKIGGLMAGDGADAPSTVGYPVGQNVPLTVPLTNPFKRMFRNVRATFFVDGASMSSRLMGSLMPKQTKTVSFNEFKPTKSGKYNLEVRFEAVGLKNKMQLAKASCQINVLDSTEAKPLIRPGVIPSATAAGGGTSPTGRPLIKIARPSFGLMPTVVKTSIIRPIFLPSPGSTKPAAGAPARPLTLPVIGAFTASRGASITIASGGIGISPFPPAENAKVSVSASIKNSGLSPARSVKVEAFLDNATLHSKTLDLPAGQQAVASGFDSFPAKLGTHTVKVVVTFDGKPQESSRNFEVKKGLAIARPMFNFAAIGGVAFTGNDIQLNPVPQPSKPTSISVNVRNPGGAAAANVQFDAFADGQKIGTVNKTIGALQTVSISGFPNWNPTAGDHKVRIVATVAKRQIAAEKSLKVMTTIPLRTIVRPSFTLPGTGIRPKIGGATTPGATGNTGRPTITLPRPGSGGVDVGVAVGDISLSPPNPQAGQDVVIHVNFHNFGGQEAVGALLTIEFQVDRNTKKALNLPVTIPAGGDKVQNWKVRPEAGKKLFVFARIAHKDDKNATNGAAAMSVDLGAGSPGLVRPGINPGGIQPGGVALPGGIRPGLATPDVAIGPADITFNPSSVRVGDTLNFSVKVSNLGKANAIGAKLTLVLNKDGSQFETKEFNLNINAGQSATQPYSIKVPQSRQMQLQASVSVAGDANPGNGQGSATVNVIQSIIPIRPGVTPGGISPGITLPPLAPDVMLGLGSVVPSTRAVKAGDLIRFTIKVRNVGKGNAKNAELKVRLLVDGKAAMRDQSFTFDVAPGATVERTVSLKIPAGKQIQCNAQVACTGDANASNNSGGAMVLIGS